MEFVNVKVVHPSSLESSNLKRQNTGKVLIKNEFVKLKLLQITRGPCPNVKGDAMNLRLG